MLNKVKLSKVSLLFGISLLLPVFLLAASNRWRDIRGSYFLDPDSLVMASGTIVSSKVYTETSNGRTYYHYSIYYEFDADGQAFHSNKVTFSFTGTRSPEFAESYVSKYPVGRAVTVFHNENDPSFSVLEPSVKDRNLAIVLGGSLVSAVSLLWALLELAKSKSGRLG